MVMGTGPRPRCPWRLSARNSLFSAPIVHCALGIVQRDGGCAPGLHNAIDPIGYAVSSTGFDFVAFFFGAAAAAFFVGITKWSITFGVSSGAPGPRS